MRFDNRGNRIPRTEESSTDIEKSNAAIENLTDEQKAAFREAKSPEEILNVAKKHGMELSMEELDAVSGGENRWNECSKDTSSGPY